jgi:hypothetical protein
MDAPLRRQVGRRVSAFLEHVLEKLNDFFDRDMRQGSVFGASSYRLTNSTRANKRAPPSLQHCRKNGR